MLVSRATVNASATGQWRLLGGIYLLTGQVHVCVEVHHRSRAFIGFLRNLNAAFASETAIKAILDNHSSQVTKEADKWFAVQRDGSITFVFTPKYCSWLYLAEGFFSKMVRSVLLHIWAASKSELKQRILAHLDDLHRGPLSTSPPIQSYPDSVIGVVPWKRRTRCRHVQ
jgi:transposase